MTACLGGLTFLFLAPKYKNNILRDAIGGPASINSDVQGLVQDLKSQASRQKETTGGKALEPTTPQCLRLNAFRIEDEYRILYRGTVSPPEKIFPTGFLSGAWKVNQEMRFPEAEDASLQELKDHIEYGRKPLRDPFISTSESTIVAGAFAGTGWIYLIQTNRGLKTIDLLQKKGGNEELAQRYKHEKEVAVPAHIPTAEIVGAWPWEYGMFGSESSEHVFEFYKKFPMARYGSFIRNPNYSGSLKLVGDICPPNL